MKRIIVLLLFTSIPALADDVSGVWKVDGSIADHPIVATCTFKQAETHISGTCKVDPDLTLDAKGEVTDKQVKWTYSQEHEGTVYTLTYTGTLDSASSMKGSIAVDPSDSEGDFTARKQ
jgi:hypothetical protein